MVTAIWQVIIKGAFTKQHFFLWHSHGPPNVPSGRDAFWEGSSLKAKDMEMLLYSSSSKRKVSRVEDLLEIPKQGKKLKIFWPTYLQHLKKDLTVAVVITSLSSRTSHNHCLRQSQITRVLLCKRNKSSCCPTGIFINPLFTLWIIEWWQSKHVKDGHKSTLLTAFKTSLILK